jgi:hypothetical protein
MDFFGYQEFNLTVGRLFVVSMNGVKFNFFL